MEMAMNDIETKETNPYLTMPLDRVRQDALHGVRLARLAWRVRDPEDAARELGRVVEPGREQEQAERTRRILAAAGDYLRTQTGHVRNCAKDPGSLVR
jgi:hypothetical protein